MEKSNHLSIWLPEAVKERIEYFPENNQKMDCHSLGVLSAILTYNERNTKNNTN